MSQSAMSGVVLRRINSNHRLPRLEATTCQSISYVSCSTSRHVWTPTRSAKHSKDSENLPQPVDLLERYRGLVALGEIDYDEEQVRVVMQVRIQHYQI